MNDQDLHPPVRSAAHVRMHSGLAHGLWCMSLFLGLLGLALQARAAGGNHSVDDAAMLDPGQCEVETWADRERGGSRTLLHGGAGCRVGPVELALNADRVRLAGAGASFSAGPQLKWARPINDALSAGIVLSSAWQDTSPQYAGSTVIVPVTWQAGDAWRVHLNLGRDFRPGAPDGNRAGASVEWAPLPAWSFVAERFRESGTNFWRGGARYAVSPSVSVDLSHARGLGGSAPGWWSLGLNWAFQR